MLRNLAKLNRIQPNGNQLNRIQPISGHLNRIQPNRGQPNGIKPISGHLNPIQSISDQLNSQPIRLCSTNVDYADTMPNYFKQREELLINLLKNHDFSDKQQNSICKFVKENQIQLTDQDLFKIDNSVKFWKKFVLEKPRLSKDKEELIDHLHVLSITEPSLLFIDSMEMKKRVNLVQHSGFCDSKSDVANLFMKAPKGRRSVMVVSLMMLSIESEFSTVNHFNLTHTLSLYSPQPSSFKNGRTSF